MLKISPFIEKREKVSYAQENDERRGNIDCSAGSNPYGFSDFVLRAAQGLAERRTVFSDYPDGLSLKRAIVDFWSPYVRLSVNRILHCEGSIAGIYLVNLLFQRQGAAVLGICPQFSDYAANARMLGYDYRCVPLLAEENYKFRADRLLEAIVPGLSLIYIDNPNNPTGQMISLADMRLVLKKASRYDVCVVADEAYGDYFPRGESSATLLEEFDNLIVLRTFSKGFGLAGLRAGYLLAGEGLCRQFDKISNPYVISQPGRVLAEAALLDTAFIDQCREAFSRSKTALKQCVGNRLRMAETLDACPILLLWHIDTAVDLSVEFARRGIKVYSGADFESMGPNSIRLRLPRADQLDGLLFAIKEIND